MEEQIKNNRKFFFILITLGIILIILGSGLLYVGGIISDELNYVYTIIYEPGDHLANADIDIDSILYSVPSQITPLYIRYSWEFFFLIPAIIVFICAILTLFSGYFINIKKRQKLVSIGLNFSIAGAIIILHLPLSFFIERLWLTWWFIYGAEFYQIYLLFTIELLIIVIIAIISILLSKKTKKRRLTEYYFN